MNMSLRESVSEWDNGGSRPSAGQHGLPPRGLGGMDLT